MQQDKGIEKIIRSTGQKVKTTGLMLDTGFEGWGVEVIYKNGIKAWFFSHELKDISNH